MIPTSTRNLKNQKLWEERGGTVCTPRERGRGVLPAPTPRPRGAKGPHAPVLQGGPWVLAAAHAHHERGEEAEEGGHGEAHAIHGLVAQEAAAVHVGLDPQHRAAAFTETGELEE